MLTDTCKLISWVTWVMKNYLNPIANNFKVSVGNQDETVLETREAIRLLNDYSLPTVGWRRQSERSKRENVWAEINCLSSNTKGVC